MSITKKRDGWTCICDGCGDKLPAEDTFEEAVEAKANEGWISEKDESGRWLNFCPDCQ